MPKKKPRLTPKKPRKRARKRKPPSLRVVPVNTLKPELREAAHAGLVAAIEHTHNFWNISDGYKKYIEHQIEAQAQALMAAVRAVLRDELHRLERKRIQFGMSNASRKRRGHR